MFQPLVELNDQSGGKLLPAMLAAFLDDECPHGLQQLRAAVAAGDQAGIAQAAHKLRGSCATLGIKGMAAVCTDIEARAKAGAVTDPSALLERLVAELSAAEEALAPYR